MRSFWQYASLQICSKVNAYLYDTNVAIIDMKPKNVQQNNDDIKRKKGGIIINKKAATMIKK